MIPPLFMVFYRLMRSAWSVGSIVMRLFMADSNSSTTTMPFWWWSLE